ncbi:hypothetical protein [uncultured Vagococcus sp.]|uniref:hypothetical protein n=1 Tax=uncultured Vagococcus sp. TaxID=189676 RepID=UPI0028D38188|nr:hypothetical protein [uncultured Vagococcus sp.]
MTDNVEELTMIYDRLIENIQDFSMSADKQIEKLRGFAIADEIASDFSDITLKYAKELFENNWITSDQYGLFLNIDRELEGMNGYKELWNEDSLKYSAEWEKCRLMGRELLKSLGY